MRATRAALLVLTLGVAAAGAARAAKALPDAPPAEAPSIGEQFKAMGEAPPDSDPAAQAAWRIRHYDLEIESDRRQAERSAHSAERERRVLDHFKAGDAGEPDRLRVLGAFDNFSSLRSLSELHAQAAASARAAVAEAEAVRLAVAAGRRPAADLADARARSAQAQRLALAAAQARADKLSAVNRAMVPAPPAAVAIGPVRPPIGMQLGDVLAAQERARLEAVAYAEVRDAVEAGRRPPSDLEAARRALKAAQLVVYDQADAMLKSNLALMAKLRADAARHVEEQQIRIAEEEKELPTLGPEARQRAEDRLRMSRELLESFQRSASLPDRMPTPRKRPDLPILPPRS